MQNIKDYLTSEGWKKDWQETKTLYEDGLVNRINNAIKTYDKGMCDNNPNYKISTLAVLCGTLSIGVLDPNEYNSIIDFSLQGYGLLTSMLTLSYLGTNVIRNPPAFEVH